MPNGMVIQSISIQTQLQNGFAVSFVDVVMYMYIEKNKKMFCKEAPWIEIIELRRYNGELTNVPKQP